MMHYDCKEMNSLPVNGYLERVIFLGAQSNVESFTKNICVCYIESMMLVVDFLD